MGEVVPVSVVVPTVGRLALLRACLVSLAACRPRAEEVVLVDQSESGEVSALVGELAVPGVRVLACERRGVAYGTNVGLEAARHDVVLVTHDDCTVEAEWVGVAHALSASDPGRLLTGRVRPGGDPERVPSTIDLPLPRDYVHGRDFSVLWPNNMVVSRSLALALGGFDERIPFAEDNDFCYRWLRAGHAMRYEPSLVVWHHEWRSEPELERLYVDYARGQGYVYAKHLRRGDIRILRWLARDVYAGARGHAARWLLGRPRWSDAAQGILRGLPQGLVEGWRVYGRAGRAG